MILNAVKRLYPDVVAFLLLLIVMKGLRKNKIPNYIFEDARQMRFLNYIIIFAIFLTFLIGCAVNTGVSSPAKEDELGKLEVDKLIEKVGFDAKNFLVDEYIDYIKRPKIFISVEVSSNFDREDVAL